MSTSIIGRGVGINDSQHMYNTDVKYVSQLFTWEDYIVGSYLSLVCALAVLLNSIVIYTCLRNWNTLVTSDYYILNLACSDIILPMCGFPLAISSSYKHLWIFGDFGCIVYGFLGFFFGLVSITTLMVMGASRYISVCHPGKEFNDYRITVKVLLGCYLYALIWSVIPLTGWGSYTVEAYGTSCTLQWNRNRSFITLMSFFCIVTPSCVIVLAYGLILLKCRKSSRKLNSRWGAKRSKNVSRKEGYLIKMTFAMCWGFLVCWMPYAVVSMWTAYGDPTMLPNRITVTAVLLAKTSTVVNPVIYVMMSRKFRPMLTEVFKSLYKSSSSSCVYEQNTQQTPARCYKNSREFSQSSEDDSSSSTIRTIRVKCDSSSSSKEVYV